MRENGRERKGTRERVRICKRWEKEGEHGNLERKTMFLCEIACVSQKKRKKKKETDC